MGSNQKGLSRFSNEIPLNTRGNRISLYKFFQLNTNACGVKINHPRYRASCAQMDRFPRSCIEGINQIE